MHEGHAQAPFCQEQGFGSDGESDYSWLAVTIRTCHVQCHVKFTVCWASVSRQEVTCHDSSVAHRLCSPESES
jgi:hypothetical protein